MLTIFLDNISSPFRNELEKLTEEQKESKVTSKFRITPYNGQWVFGMSEKEVKVSINLKRLKLYKVVLWENITIKKEYNYYWVTENLTYIGWDGCSDMMMRKEKKEE